MVTPLPSPSPPGQSSGVTTYAAIKSLPASTLSLNKPEFGLRGSVSSRYLLGGFYGPKGGASINVYLHKAITFIIVQIIFPVDSAPFLVLDMKDIDYKIYTL